MGFWNFCVTINGKYAWMGSMKKELTVMFYRYNFLNVMMQLIYTVPAVLIAVSFHEYAHGYVSDRLGDPTPRNDGRLTLNPLKHLDLYGTLSLLLFHMGWAKPVRVNTRFYKNKRRDMILVALAGPAGNFLVALVSVFFYGLFVKFTSMYGIGGYFGRLFYYIAVMNVGLGVFNLIPLPPLDGSVVLGEMLSGRADYFYGRIRRYAPVILIVLLVTGALSYPLNLLDDAILNGFWNIVKNILHIGYTVSGGSGGTIV